MAKIIRINEEELTRLIREAVDEMAYPISFRMEDFKKLTSFKARIDYCQARLPRLSSGSSRIVYKIDNEKVLKLAKNRKGLAQNAVEGANDYVMKNMDCLAKVYDIDPNFLWIEMQLARPAKESDFERICGYDFEVVQFFLDYVQQYAKQGHFVPTYYMDIFKSDIFQNEIEDNIFGSLRDYVWTYKVPVGDLQRLSSWGVVKDNGQEKLVVIDYGLNAKVLQQHYLK